MKRNSKVATEKIWQKYDPGPLTFGKEFSQQTRRYLSTVHNYIVTAKSATIL